MNILSIDCEFNQPSQSLIQIGACLFKVSPYKIDYIDSIKIYVALPDKETINPEITDLTRITPGDLLYGSTPIEAYYKLKMFHKDNKCTMNPIVWGSGTRNDSDLIYTQANPGEDNFMGFRVTDAKTIYQSKMMRNNGTIKGGLSKALKTLGLEWDYRFGEPHDALADAYNTGIIWGELTKSLTNK